MYKFIHRVILLVMLLLPAISMSQVMVSQLEMEAGVDSTKWIVLPSDTSMTKTLLSGAGDSQASELANIGFDFTFGGESYSQFSVNTDGNLSLGSVVNNLYGYNKPFTPTNVLQNLPKINAFGCDGVMTSDGYVKYALMGTAPNRILVVEYKIAKYNRTVTSSDVRWQVQLYEDSDEIKFVYGSEAPENAPTSFQIGMASGVDDVLTVNTTFNTVMYGATNTPQSSWPTENTYYRFYTPDCTIPMGLTVEDVTTHSASIRWNGSNQQSAWDYICIEGDIMSEWNMSQMTTDTMVTVNNLLPNTEYVFYLRTRCNDDLFSDSVTINFHTECVTLEVPYNDNFESYSDGIFPYCWTSVNDDSEVLGSGSASNFYSGIRCLEIPANEMVLAPRVNLLGNEMMMSAQIKAESVSVGTLEIGYVSDLTTMNFTSLLSITPNHTNYQEYVVDFSSIPQSDTVYIAFKETPGSSSWYSFLVDDISIVRSTSCYRPGYAFARDITHNSATIEWEANTAVESYSIAYSLTEFIQDAVIESSSAQSNAWILSNLYSDTTYYVWVRSNCEGESSLWRSAGSFRTQLPCAQVLNPYASSVGNTSAMISWEIDNSYGNDATAFELSYKVSTATDWFAPIVVTNQNYCYLQGLQGGYSYDVRLRTICGADSANYAYTSFITDPCGTQIGNGTESTMNLPFGGNYKYAYSQMLYPANELSGIDTIRGISLRVNEAPMQMRTIDVYMGNLNQSTLDASAPVPLDSMESVLTNATIKVEPGWVSIIFSTPFAYDGSSNLVVAIDDNTSRIEQPISVYFHNTGYSLYRRVHYPNLNPSNVNNLALSLMAGTPDIMFISDCEASVCNAPMVAVSDVNDNSITINWQSPSSSNATIVSYKLADATQWNSETVTATNYTFSNLSAGSLYDIQVGSVCGGDTLYTNLQVYTDCIAYNVPLNEQFDDFDLPCWTIGLRPNTTKKMEWLEDEALVKFGSKDGSYFITPSLTPAINTLQVQFSAGAINSYSSGALMILAGSDPQNINTFIPVDTIYIDEGIPLSPFIVSFENYSGNGSYIMFSSFMGNFKLDDISIDLIPACSMPSDIVVSEVTHEGATVSWTDEGANVVKWIVSYLKVGDTEPLNFEVPSDDGPIHFATGLDPNTDYIVTVATVCSNNDTVEALYSATFRTSCAVVGMPYHEGFDGIAFDDFHQCWYRSTPSVVGATDLPYRNVHVPSIYLGEHNGNTVVMSDNASITSSLIPIPANQIALNFDMRSQDTAYSGNMVIGFTTAPDAISTMTVVDTIFIEDTSWRNYTVNFNTLTTVDTGYVVFKNIDNSNLSFGWNSYYYMLWLDDIDFSVYNACVRPYDATISNVTSTTAQITFSDSINANDYTIAWSTDKLVASATTLDITSTTAQLTNLIPGTTYHVWVRTNCSESSHSSWTYAGDFTTHCQALEIPYSENFDSYTAGLMSDEDIFPTDYPNHQLPDCWRILGNDAADYGEPTAMITSIPSRAVSGNALNVIGATNEYLYLVLPQFIPTTDSLMISFTYKTKAVWGAENEVALGVMSNPNDISTFVPIKDVPNNKNFTTFSHAFALSSAVNSNVNYYIAFRVGGVGTSYQELYLDDLMVDYAPNCLTPIDIEINSVASNNADLVWVGLSDNYQVNYRTDTTASWIANTTNVASISLVNLTANSDYQFRVRSICGEDDTSAWSSVFEFTTLCQPMAIPWSEDFETYIVDVSSRSNTRPSTYPNHAMPTCWHFSPMTSANYGGPAVWLTSAANTNWNSHNIIEGVSLNMVSHLSFSTYAILPAMEGRIDSLTLYFEYAMASNADSLEVGVVTNPYDFSTYQSLEKYPVFTSAHAAEHYFVFDNLDLAQTYYIVIKTGNATNCSHVIDNLRVEYTPSCIRPRNLKVHNLTNNQAMIKWNTLANSSQVAYRGHDDHDWTFMMANNADSILLTNLMGNTEYQFTARALCSATDTSVWSDTIKFTTKCDANPLPYFEGFDNNVNTNDLPCWFYYQGLYTDIMNGTATLTSKEPKLSNWKIKANLGPFDGNSAYINVYGVRCNDWMVTPQIEISTAALLSFDVAFTDYHDTIPASEYADDRFYVLATADDGLTWTKVITWGPDSNDTYPMDSLTATGDSVSTTLNQFIGQTIRFAFYAESTVSGGDNDIYFKNIRVEAYNNCIAPTNLTTVTTPLTAQISWTGEGQNYELMLINATSNEMLDSVAVVGLTYTFADLDPSTTYEYRIRQVCATDLYSDWVSDVFTTQDLPCGIPAISVSNPSGFGAIVSWQQGENNVSWEVNVFNAMTNETFEVDATAYTISGLEPATEYSVAVRSQCTESIYSDWSDTIQFSTLDCYPVTEVVASQITDDGAVINWTAGGDESEWQVNYGESDFGQGEGIMVTVREHSYTIINLEPATAYDVYVRAVCGDEFTSTWSTPVCQFTTLESEPEGIDGINGDFQFGIYPNPTTNATTIRLNGVEGMVAISIIDINGRAIVTETIECGSDCEKRIDVTNLAQGTYFVRVLGDNINSVRKLIVR